MPRTSRSKAGAVLDAAGAPFDADALFSTGGADLAISDLTLRNASGNGLRVDVPASATGVVAVSLRNVELSGNGRSGLYFDDQSGGFGTGADSDASLALDLNGSRILDNGFRGDISDFDGIRADEGGAGGIVLTVSQSLISGNTDEGIKLTEGEDDTAGGDIGVRFVNVIANYNGGDGIQLEEFGDGDLIGRILASTVIGNDDGIDGEQEAPGVGTLLIVNLTASGNDDEDVDVDGIVVTEHASDYTS